MSDIFSHYGDLDPFYIFSFHGDHDPLYIFIMEILIYLYRTWRWPHMYILYHAYSWPLYSYVSRTTVCSFSCMQRYLYYIDGWLVRPLGSSSLHFLDGLIMYFGHRITPLTSHIRGHLLQLILPHMVDHIFMAFPVPLQTLWTPWTIFVPLMFPRSSLKACIIFHTQILNPFLCIYADMTLKPAYIVMCAKGQIVLEFSLMWIWVTCLLAFHMPWDCLDLAFHYPIEELYKEPFGYIEGREELRAREL